MARRSAMFAALTLSYSHAGSNSPLPLSSLLTPPLLTPPLLTPTLHTPLTPSLPHSPLPQHHLHPQAVPHSELVLVPDAGHSMGEVSRLGKHMEQKGTEHIMKTSHV